MNPQQKSSLASKILLSFGLIIVSTVYAMWQHFGRERYTVIQTSGGEMTPGQLYKAANDALLKTLSQVSDPPSAPTPVTAMPQPMMRSRLYADGSYTGNAMDAYYGTVEIKAVITGGKIAGVQFLQYPNSRPNSRAINSEAIPLLIQEAIAAQSAQVDGVSGATFTSEAFIQSLTSALALAKN